MKLKEMVQIEACFFLILMFCLQLSADSKSGNDQLLEISLTFKGPVYQGDYYSGYLPATDWVIWIEDDQHRYIKTLYVSKGVVTVGEYGAHEHHLGTWKEHAQIDINGTAPKGSEFIPELFDGITAASVYFTSGNDTTITVTWDFTDSDGKTVPQGTYYFCAEVAGIEKNKSNTPDEYVVAKIINEFSYGSVIYENGEIIQGKPTANIKRLSARMANMSIAK